MDTKEKVDAYFQKPHSFKNGIATLRKLALGTKAQETFKWQAPVYMAHGKNVFWIARFKKHFGLGFFHGALLSDPDHVLINVQEGKTVSMRHWKFTSNEEIKEDRVLAYMNEALENSIKDMTPPPKKNIPKPAVHSPLLTNALEKDAEAKTAFVNLSPYKQKEYSEYLKEAKQQKTKISRLGKILPLIKDGKGLNDRYRKS